MLKEEIKKLIDNYKAKDLIELKSVYGEKYICLSNKGKKWFNKVELLISRKLSDNNPLKRSLIYKIKKREPDQIKDIFIDLESLYEDEDLEENEIKTNFKDYDVFLSHASKDKIEYVGDLYKSLNKLGIEIFYDEKEIEWGDNFKKKILESIDKSEFAIIVISKHFFGREWTEKELDSFFNRQNNTGEKIILPVLKEITVDKLKEQYPFLSDIQAISAEKYSPDEISLLFSKVLIKRLKGI